MYRYLLIAVLLIPLAAAAEISTDSFSAEKFHTGSAGGTPETASATSRSTTTYQQGSNDEAQTTSTTENIGWFDATDVTPPSLIPILPVNDSTHIVTTTINITANATDPGGISSVIANITLPNGTVQQVELFNSQGDTFNNTYTIPDLTGNYTVRYIATDTSGNVNDTETRQFLALALVINPPTNTKFVRQDNISIDVTQIGQIGIVDVLTGLNTTTGNYSAILRMNFSGHVNASTFVINTSRTQGKGVIHNTSSTTRIINRSLLVPRIINSGDVFVCPAATSLAEVTSGCANETLISTGQTVNGMTASETSFDGEAYYLVTNITGTGGQEGGNASGTFLINETGFVERYSFLGGTFMNATLNSSTGAIILNGTNETGMFLSQVFDTNQTSKWINISWVSSAIGPLPNGGVVETEFGSGNANMTGNILLYHLDNNSDLGENSTFFVDSSPLQDNGTCTPPDCPIFTEDGKINGAEDFDGSDEAIVVGTFDPPDQGTVSMWINPDSASAAPGDRIFGFADDFEITLQTSGAGYVVSNQLFQAVAATTTSTTVLPFDEWHHITLTWDVNSNIAEIYIDGVLDTNSTNANDDPGSGTLSIGERTGADPDFDGTMDEIAIWNRTLATQEISDIYRRGSTRLNFTVRSCDDANCSGENLTDINDTSPQNLSVANNQYFQYKVTLETDNINYTPELFNVTIHYSSDTTPPNVTALIPPAGSQFNQSDTIEIGANATDDIGITSVVAKLTFPNGTMQTLTLTNAIGDKYNTSFTIPNLAGRYLVRIIATDTSNNVNDSETTYFDVDANFTFIKDGNTTIQVHGYLGSNLTNLEYNGTESALQLNGSINGTFLSQVFNAGSNVTWVNISWVSNAYAELPSDGQVETQFTADNANMTGNILLYHFNNQSSFGENDTFVFDFSGTGNNGSCSGSTCPAYDTAETQVGRSSLDFDGTDDAIVVDGTFDPPENGTVFMWVNARSTAGDRIFGFDDAYELRLLTSGGGYVFSNHLFASGAATTTGDIVMDFNEWHCLAATYDSTTNVAEVYVDGVLDESDTTADDDPGTGTLSIGRRTGASPTFDGNMDEVAIFDRVLSANEIAANCRRGYRALNFSVRSCDDANCTGENLTDINDTSPQNLSVANNQYFQYNIEFTSTNTNYTPIVHNVTITLQSGGPDLIPLTIEFNNTNPGENENITINSTIINNGTQGAGSFIVQFFDGLCGSGTQINGNQTVNSLAANANITVNVSYIAFPVGPHNISVCVDVTDNVAETNETNNNLTVVLNVKAYNNYYGELSGNITLDNNLNQTEYDWTAVDGGNVYFIDADASVDFQSLQALGRNITGEPANTDFSDADTNLNMSGFNDSIQVLWAINASLAKQTTNFTVFGDIIENVPYINSTNSSNFITGILWDTSDDSGGEYDTTDKEDLVFIARINRDQTGGFGSVDYEAHVPVLLREVNTTTNNIRFFVELR